MDFTLTPELAFLFGVAVFWIVLYVLAYAFHLDKHGLEVKLGYFIYKSKPLNSFLDRVASRWHTLWLVLSNIGLAFSIGLMAYSIYFFGNNLLRLSFALAKIPAVEPAGVSLAIPVLSIRLYWLPYYFLAVAILILSHELAHGIVARSEGIPVLSTGVLTFLVIFGAFVEPDEKEFEKSSLLSRLRMLAAGSSTNLITAFLFLLLLTGLFFPSPAGVLIQEVVPNSPADRAGLRQWDVIKAINGNPIHVPPDCSIYMSKVTPGTQIILTVLHDNREIAKNITTESDPNNSSRAIIGFISSFVPYRQNILGLDQYNGINLFWTLFWTFWWGVNVAIFNMFPAFPFDGEKALYYPLASLVKKRKRELRLILNILAWGLYVLNFALSFWLYGLVRI